MMELGVYVARHHEQKRSQRKNNHTWIFSESKNKEFDENLIIHSKRQYSFAAIISLGFSIV